MNIGCLMFHAIRVEETTSKREDRNSKRTRSFEGRAINDRVWIQDNHKFKMRLSNEVPSKFPKDREERDPRPRV